MSNTLYLVCVCFVVALCTFLFCFAVSLRYQALPEEEYENMFSVQKNSKFFRAGKKMSCQINCKCEYLPFRAWLHMVHPSV